MTPIRNPARLAAVAALLVVAWAAAPGNAVAQGSSAQGSGQTAAPVQGAAPAAPDAGKPTRARRKSGDAASKREPTAGQMAARERQRKCAAEWKETKAAGKVAAGTTWPKFWSQCNTRLKEQRA